MRRRRLSLPPPIEAGSVRVLDEPRRHYLRDVLRLPDGAALEVFDGEGSRWSARLGRDPTGASLVAIGERLPDPGSDPRLALVLVQALTHPRSIDEVIARATEIGVETIVPVLAARGRVRFGAAEAERRRTRWQTIAREAARQCGRAHVPDCRPPRPLTDALTGFASPLPGERRVLLSPEASRPLGASDTTPLRLVLMVGPEGGWTEDEKTLASRHGFELCRLGPRTLRTQTAGLAALAVAGVLWGDLGD